MSDEQLLVTLGVKDKGASTQIKELNKELKSLDKVYSTGAKGSKEFEKSQEGLKQKLDYLGKKYDITKTKLSAYKKQMDQAKQGVQKKKEELEKLKSAEGDNTAAIQKAESQLQKYQTQMNNASRNINETEAELKKLEREIESTNNEMKSSATKNYAESIDKVGTGVEKMGQKISSVGQKVTLLGAGIVALGKKAVDCFNEVDDGADNLIRATGATGEQAEKLTEVYNKLNEESQAAFSDVGSALGEVNTRFGYTGDQAEKCTLSFLHFADITGQDATQSVQLVSRAMGDAGIKADEYADVLDNLAVAGQASGISVDKLTESLTKYGAPMRALGFTTKENIALFSSWEKAGVNTEIAFSGMKKAISNWGAAGKDSSKEFKKTLEEIKKAPNIAKATTKAIEVFGAKAGPDLADAIKGGRFEYESFLKLIENSKGTVENTYREVNSEAEEQSVIAVKKAKMTMAELGEQILVEVAPVMEDLAGMLKEAVEWFKNLDDETKENIKSFLKITVVAGPLLTIVGKLTTGVGGLVKGSVKLGKGVGNLITKLKGVQGGAKVAEGAIGKTGSTMASATTSSTKLLTSMKTLGECTAVTAPAWITLGTVIKGAKTVTDLQNSSILKTTDSMSLWEKSIDKLCNGGFHKSKEELQEMGLIYKDFNSSVSPDFQKQVEDSATEVRNLALEIDKVNIDGIITDTEKKALVRRVDEMCTEAINAIKGHSEEGTKALEKMFNADGIIDDTEKKLLNGSSQTERDTIKKIEEIQAKTDKLIEDGAEKNKAQIQKNAKEVQKLKLDILNKDQSDYIESFNERVNKLDLEGIEKELTNYRAELNEKNKAIHDTYDKGIEEAEYYADRTTGIDHDAWVKKAEDSKKQRDKELKQNEKYYDKFVDVCINGNEKAREQINMITGKVMNDTEMHNQKKLLEIKNTYDGLSKITESGCYEMYNNQTHTMEKVAVKIDEETGKIAGVWESSSNTVGECAEGMGKEAQKMARDTQNATLTVEEANKYMANCTVDSSNRIVDANGNIVDSLKEVKTNTDGTKTAVMDLNGTPINIKINENGTITVLDNINQRVGWLQQMGNVVINTVVAKKEQDAWNSGNLYGPPRPYASGTTNATRGVHLVGEEGPELVYFKGGETVLNATKTRNLITNGSYLNPGTVESTRLLNTSNVYNNNTYNNASNNIDMNVLGNIIAQSVASAIQGISVKMDSKTVGEILDTQNGNKMAWQRRLNGC